MSNIRSFRNQIIRSNFGTAGVREYRRLGRERAKLVKTSRHLLNQGVAIYLSTSEADLLNKLRGKWRMRRIYKQVTRLATQYNKLVYTQLLLVMPEKLIPRRYSRGN